MTGKAVQQIMLGTVMNNEAQALETMRLLKQAGYDGIELNEFMIHPTPLMVKLLTKAAGMPTGNGGKLDWPKLIDQSGLSVPSVHQYLNSIEKDPDAAAAEAHAFHTFYVSLTGMYRFDYSSEEQIHDLAKRLNAAGEQLAKRGIQFLYHNHNCEFQKVKQDTCAYQILLEEKDPSFVNFEFDSYWCIDSGADALVWMKRLSNRMKLYHINDRGSRTKGPSNTPILKEDSMELGTGNIELEPLLNQALANGVDAVILESHRNWIDKSPVKSMQMSAEWMNRRI